MNTLTILKKFTLAVIIMAGLGVASYAQTPNSSVSVLVTATQTGNVSFSPETFGMSVQIKHRMSNMFMLDNTTDGAIARTGWDSGHSVSNTSLLRAYAGDKHTAFFVGGGMKFGRESVAKVSNTTVNPAITAGLDFSLAKVQVEPYGLFLANDLNGSSKSRSLGAGLQFVIPATDSVGVKFQVSGSRTSALVGSTPTREFKNVYGAGIGLQF